MMMDQIRDENEKKNLVVLIVDEVVITAYSQFYKG